jgi:hypothetical protein
MEKIYFYSDLSAHYFTGTKVLANNITEADAKIVALGLNPMRLACAIGIKLVILDITQVIRLAGYGKLVNEFIFPAPTFTSQIFDNEYELVKAHKRFFKNALYNPNLQFFWQPPTSHHHKLHIMANAEVRAVIEKIDDEERLQRNVTA